MFNNLEKILKKIKGNVLLIACDDAFLKFLDSNNSVNLYSITKQDNKSAKKASSKMKFNRSKNINIKKLRKKINKKSVDFLFINIDEVRQYYKYIIKDTIYICNNIIYLYSNNKISKDFIIDKYNRYDTNIECTLYKDGYLIKIDATKAHNKYIKDKIYFVKDTLYNIADTIGNILIS